MGLTWVGVGSKRKQEGPISQLSPNHATCLPVDTKSRPSGPNEKHKRWKIIYKYLSQKKIKKHKISSLLNMPIYSYLTLANIHFQA